MTYAIFICLVTIWFFISIYREPKRDYYGRAIWCIWCKGEKTDNPKCQCHYYEEETNLGS